MTMWIARLLFVVTVALAMPADDSKGKAFSLFSVVTFKNEECTTTMETTMKGVCQTAEECGDSGGTASGNCASGFGVCCFHTVTEASTSKVITNNITYIQNTGFPTAVGNSAPLAALSSNSYTVQQDSSICQVRFDFDTAVLDVPGSTGACQTGEAITVSSPATTRVGVTNLCGTISGSHIYLDNDVTSSSAAATISITHDADSFARTWKIKVSILECDNPSLAPSGCRQYYTGTGGTISSFGFSTSSIFLENQDYSACIRQEAGMCSFSVSEATSTPDAFQLIGQSIITAATAAQVGAIEATPQANCDLKFIVIGNTGVNSPRYCGGLLASTDLATTSSPVISNVVPFKIGVVSTVAATAPGTGFNLKYSQIPC